MTPTRGAAPGITASSGQDAPAASGPSPLSLDRLTSLLRQHWKLLAAVTLAVTAVVIAVTLSIKPQWTGVATIQIEPNRRAQTEAQPVGQGALPDQAVIDTQVALMTSPDVLAGVVRRLSLQNDSRYAPARLSDADRINAAVGVLTGRVRAERQGATYLVSLAVRNEDPVQAAKLANAIADGYLAASLEVRADTAMVQSQTLRRQLDELGAQVREAEARVAAYRGARGIVRDGTAGTVTDQQIQPIAGSLVTAEADAASANAKLAVARAQMARGDIDAVESVLNSAVITDLRRQRAEVLRRKGENDAVYGPSNSDTIAINQQLAVLDQQITAEANRIVGGLAATASAASATATRQRGKLSSLRAEQAGNARASVSAESLERDAEAKRTVYNQLAQTAQEAAQRRSGAIAIGALVHRALPPARPSFPNKPLFAALGVVLGLLSGIATVVAVELVNKGLKTPEELEQVTGVGFVASVQRLSPRKLRRATATNKPWDYLVARPMSAYAEALRDIRSALQLSPRDTPCKVVALVSALPDEGKSSLAASLARAMAIGGDRTLLIDADLGRNAFVTMLPGVPQAGLIEVLDGGTPLEAALVTDDATGLQILPLVGSSFSKRDVLGGPEFAVLLERCRGMFDHIVINTPPLLAVADARKIAALADANLLAVRWNGTSRFAVQAAMGRLRRDATPVWGAVFTMADAGSAALGLTDPASYSREYKAYQD